MTEIVEYCKNCLKGICTSHEWFGKPKTEDEILLVTLKRVSGIFPAIIEKMFLVDRVLVDKYERFDTSGQINFIIDTITSHKKDEYYIPVTCCNPLDEGINDYVVEIEVHVERHNPIFLKIYRNGFERIGGEPLYSIELIKESDFLHYDFLPHYNPIVNLAKERLQQFMDTIGRTAT